jgi:hypothetical protein
MGLQLYTLCECEYNENKICKLEGSLSRSTATVVAVPTNVRRPCTVTREEGSCALLWTHD